MSMVRRLFSMPMIRRLFRFAQMSVGSFAVMFGSTVALHEWCGLPEEASFAIALVVVFVMNFMIMRYYVYSGRAGNVKRQFALYVVSAIGFRTFEYLAFLGLLYSLDADYRLIVIAVTLVAAFVKFIYYRFLFERPAAG